MSPIRNFLDNHDPALSKAQPGRWGYFCDTTQSSSFLRLSGEASWGRWPTPRSIEIAFRVGGTTSDLNVDDVRLEVLR